MCAHAHLMGAAHMVTSKMLIFLSTCAYAHICCVSGCFVAGCLTSCAKVHTQLCMCVWVCVCVLFKEVFQHYEKKKNLHAR